MGLNQCKWAIIYGPGGKGLDRSVVDRGPAGQPRGQMLLREWVSGEPYVNTGSDAVEPETG